MNHEKRQEILLDVARLIWKHETTIGEFYKALGANLEDNRLDADNEVSVLSGIMTGWKNNPGQ